MREVHACGVLVVRGTPIDSFLLMIHPTRYDLPKGHREPGESEVQCALRELEEETGIPPDGVELDPDFRFRTAYQVRPPKPGAPAYTKKLLVFLGRLCGEHRIVPSEHHGFQWFPWNPPHQIQSQTIDPLLAELERHLARTA
jgi:8-oxo-dGTP pyrophosphatase MutT (NUDIX family)